ncbi:MAG: hypothetical protein ACO3JL_05585, partial [Myxococcota bacterium]
VRFATPRPRSAEVSIPSTLTTDLGDALRGAGLPIRQVVVVGTDALLAGDREVPGWEDAIEALGSLFDVCTSQQVDFVWRTRGGINGSLPYPLQRALAAAGDLITVEVGLPSLRPSLCQELEGGGTAAPEQRLRLLSALATRGVNSRVLVEPLVPMLNDQPAEIEALLQALADAGVHRAAVRYLVLTRARVKLLTHRLSRMHRALVQGLFSGQPWGHGEEPQKVLPPTLRARGHLRARSVGARVGVVVDVLDPVLPEEAAPVLAEEQAETEAPRGRRRGRRERPQLDLFRARR